MRNFVSLYLTTVVAIAIAQTVIADTDIFFNPLTQSAAVVPPNHMNELSAPWQVSAGLTQENLLNHWKNLFEDRTDRVANLSDVDIMTYGTGSV
jgi:hypothetical protein